MEFFKSIGEEYKAEIIASIPADQAIGLYRQGDFIDLCRGPHVPSTGKLSAFKLTKVAGAYWRGDSNNEMLQRIYGTAWSNKKELKAYINRLAEAEKRDHRKINKKLDLYHMQEEAPGSIFWHPKGWSVYSAIEEYMRGKQRAQGYQEIKTPQIVDMSLWEKSGHADKFGDDMFSLQTDDRTYAVKPMNCPCHVQVFNQGLKSLQRLCLCDWLSLVPVTAMSRRDHCTALCGCALLLRMMRTFSVQKSRFSRKCPSLLISCTRSMQTLASMKSSTASRLARRASGFR